jgi:hypothetical protein
VVSLAEFEFEFERTRLIGCVPADAVHVLFRLVLVVQQATASPLRLVSLSSSIVERTARSRRCTIDVMSSQAKPVTAKPAAKAPPLTKAQLEAERQRVEAEAAAKAEAERQAAEAILEAERAAKFDLQTCAAQDYLARTVYPVLVQALEQVDHVRPADPVEYLALLLHKEAATTNRRVTQLNEIHKIREELRAEYTKEYSLTGRV